MVFGDADCFDRTCRLTAGKLLESVDPNPTHYQLPQSKDRHYRRKPLWRFLLSQSAMRGGNIRPAPPSKSFRLGRGELQVG
jgi:hypothetical protein